MKIVLVLITILTFQSCFSEDSKPDIELLHLDFENESYYPWEGQFNDKNFQIITDTTNGINKCAAFTLFENEEKNQCTFFDTKQDNQ